MSFRKSFSKFFLVFVASFAGLSASLAQSAELQTVSSVDVARYLGRWYEIARLPQATQPSCTAVTADYSLNEDGSIKVFNSCRIEDPVNGRLITIAGRAAPVDASNSKLEVEFFVGAPKGNYWVLELDADYRFALVGEPSRTSLFVLSRTPTLEPETLQKLLDLAVQKHGYDVSQLIYTVQVPR